MTELPTSSVPHYDILKNALPPWLADITPDRRSDLAQPESIVANWYNNASAAQHRTLKRLNDQAWIAQNSVDTAMAQLKSPQAFGAERLQAALKAQYGVSIDVRSTWLQLYIPLKIAGFTVKPGAARTWSVSLIEAALHNFEASETAVDAYDSASTFSTRPTAAGHFEALPGVAAQITVAQFTALCRQLDIGAAYQRYLRDYLDLDNAVAQARLRQRLQHSHMSALKCALYMALLKQDLPQSGYDSVIGLLNGQAHSANGCQPLLRYELSILSTRLAGIVLFADDLATSRSVVPVIAWIPDDPQHPIKHYPSGQAFMRALCEQLRDPDYQRFFSRFVAHEDLGTFFADLNQRLTQVTWHAHIPGESTASWRETAVARPNLQFRPMPIAGDLFEHLYQVKLNKLLNDARTQAVSTASVDQQARWERWAVLQKIGSTLLQILAFIATPFVPPLGALVLGYSAYQLLDDAFEGIVDWAEGQRREALGHALSFSEQLVQLGMFGVGLPIAADLLRASLPANVLGFIDALSPVTRPSGDTRLWKPDLAPYRHDLSIPKDLRPDAQGILWHHGKPVLRLDDGYYRLRTDATSGRHTLEHPTRADAYRPSVMTNGHGAWLTELERPLSWDTPTLLRRLGHQVDNLSDTRLQQAQDISATHDNLLRHMHINQQPPPPLLADSLKRFTLDQRLQDFVTQMNSDDPAVYRQADPRIQLQLVVTYEPWPQTRTLRFLDPRGNTLWEFARNGEASVVQVHQAQLENGDLLRVLIESLDESERKSLLEEPFGTPPSSAQTRANAWRKRLARLAWDKRFALFDAHYRGLETARNARVQRIIDAAPNPGLPTSVAEEILAGADGDELRALDRATVPARLKELADWAQLQVRTTRAYEGLYLEASDSPDTPRLALHSLENLPGWQASTRLEVRRYQVNGTLLDAIGPEDAEVRRVLVHTVEGDYVPYDQQNALFGSSDFYTALLQALPDARRDALNIHIGQGERLKQAIAAHALGREPLRRLLHADPLIKPPYNPAFMRLRGGMDGYRPADAPQPGSSQELTLEQRAHDLLPTLSAEQVRDLVQTLESRPGGALATLVTLKNEYMRLDVGLSLWVSSTPRFRAVSEAPMSEAEYDYARRNRELWATEIRRAWRQETEVDQYYEAMSRNGHVLKLTAPIIGELPRLSARMEHISRLEVVGDGQPLQINTFLQLFPRLRNLTLRHLALEGLPENIAAMPNLNELILSDCQLRLNQEAHGRLSALSRLVTLDLYNNPLGRTPTVEHMPNLKYLDLNHTGITELPAGLLTRQDLTLALLSHNRIQTLPAELFDAPARISDKLDLSENPLSRASLERVKAHFQRTARHWGISADPADVAQAQQLYPTFSSDEINRFIFALPGNLEAGRITLTRLELEYLGIRGDMQDWADAPLLSTAERTYRNLFLQDVEAAWRREIPLDAQHQGLTTGYELTLRKPVSGTLPSLHTTFDHVTALSLHGAGAELRLGAFLQAFPALKRLTMRQYSLDALPLSITNLRQLTQLSLNRTRLRLTPLAANALSGMVNLEQLDLSDNPLEHIPDTRRLTRLSRLSLSNTGLTEIPADLLSLPPRTYLDLSHNALENLPDQAFNLPVNVAARVDLSANPLSRPALRRIKAYYQATGEFWLATPPAEDLQRIRALYPAISDTEQARIYFDLPGDIDGAAHQITRLGQEYEQLRSQLQEWALNVPTRDPLLDTVLDVGARAEEQLRRMHFKALLESCWRREVEPDEAGNVPPYHTYKLVFHGQLLGPLPTLRAHFGHVTLLELIGEGTSQSVDGLLRCFPNLKHLVIERYVLGDIPAPVFALHSLRNLTLTENMIRLTPQSAGQLASLENLIYLDLSDNTLGITPDVRNLQRLTTLYLHNCGLTEVPIGVFNLGRLRILDASDNLIEHLPSDLLEMPLPINDDSDLSGNPLSDESIELLRQYYQQTGYELGVEAAMFDEHGVPLLPPGTPEPMET